MLCAHNQRSASSVEREESHPHLPSLRPITKEPTGIVESVNRTLRGLLARYTETIDSNWPKALPDLVENYNSSKHSSLKAAPDDVTKTQMEKLAAQQYVKAIPYLRLLDSFHEGDKVRVALKRKLFKKGTQTFGKEIHEIEGQRGYQLQLEDGSLHVPRDLLKVGTVETHAPAAVAVSEESRLKKKRQQKSLKVIADYTTAPKSTKVTRSQAAAPADTLKKSHRLPAALRKLADYNAVPK